MTLGERLRAAIDRKGVSHAWVAEEVGITAASLSLILTGKTVDPSFFTVLAIARIINEPLSAIVDDPLKIWTAEELGRLQEMGEWLAERTKRESVGTPLQIPPRQKRSASRPGGARAAAGAVEIYPDAFERARDRIPAQFKKKRANAVFEVVGESMTGDGIFPRDSLYVRRTRETDEAIGKIVVCTLDTMILVKRLRVRNQNLELESSHPDHGPIVVDESASRFELIGIVVGTSRG